MDNKKKEIEEFYTQILSDFKLKERIEDKAKKIVNEEDLRKLIREEIMPLMKKYNSNFSEQELLEYEEEALKELSEDALESVSGGRGLAIKPLLGLGILSLSIFGGIGLDAFAGKEGEKGKPGASQTSKRGTKTQTQKKVTTKKVDNNNSSDYDANDDDSDTSNSSDKNTEKQKMKKIKKSKKQTTDPKIRADNLKKRRAKNLRKYKENQLKNNKNKDYDDDDQDIKSSINNSSSDEGQSLQALNESGSKQKEAVKVTSDSGDSSDDNQNLKRNRNKKKSKSKEDKMAKKIANYISFIFEDKGPVPIEDFLNRNLSRSNSDDLNYTILFIHHNLTNPENWNFDQSSAIKILQKLKIFAPTNMFENHTEIEADIFFYAKLLAEKFGIDYDTENIEENDNLNNNDDNRNDNDNVNNEAETRKNDNVGENKNSTDNDFKGTDNEEDEANSGECGADVRWNFEKSTGMLKIFGQGDMYDCGTYEFAPWNNIKDSIVTVVVEEGVTSIGAGTFFACNNLTEVTIAGTVKSIGEDAFYSSHRLKQINFKGTNEPRYGEHVLDGTDNGINITVPPNYNGDTFCELEVNKGGLTDSENNNDNANSNSSANTQQDDIKNGVTSFLYRAENQNLIDESRENDYRQAKNENLIAIGGGHIFNYVSDSSSNGVIFTDCFSKVKDGILEIPCKVITQYGQVLPVVGIGGEKFRIANFNTIVINPLTKSFKIEDASFYKNQNIKTVDCSKATNLEYLEIGDSAFAGSSLKRFLPPSSKIEKIVTGKNAYGSGGRETIGKGIIKENDQAPITFYESYDNKPSGFFGFFKKVSNTIIDQANHVLNKLKSIINFSCLKDDEYNIIHPSLESIKGDLNSVVNAVENSKLDSLDQGDRKLLLNAHNLLEKKDYDSQININYDDSNNNDNDNNTSSDDNSINDNNDNNNNDDSGFGGHDNDDDNNNNQGPEELVDTKVNSKQQSDYKPLENQAEAHPKVNNNKAATSEAEDNNTDGASESKVSTQQIDNENENSFSWKITDDGILNISGSGEMPDFGIDTPWLKNIKKIKKINISEGITAISRYAFKDCENLVEINLPQSLKEIGSEAFEGCKKLNKLSIPDGVTEICSGAFLGCDNLTEVALNSYADVDDKYEVGALFYNKNIKKITFGKSVTNIKFENFNRLINLEEFAVDEGNKNFMVINGMLVSKGNQGLTLVRCPRGKTGDIIVPENIAKIEKHAFKDCQNLSKVTLENGVKEIEENAFKNCADDILNLTLNSNEEAERDFSKIGQYIKKITLGENVTQLNNDIFANFPELKAIEVDANNQNYTSMDGVLYSKDGQTIECYPVNKQGKVYIFPRGVTKIGAKAFAKNEDLAAVSMPPTVTSIGESAFAQSKIKSISIPNAVREIPEGTFENCKKLSSIHFNDHLQVIGDRAFKGCTFLKKINIPENLQMIGNNAFNDCYSLHDKFPQNDSLKIGNDAFEGSNISISHNVTNLSKTYVEEDITDREEDNEVAVSNADDLENSNLTDQNSKPQSQTSNIAKEDDSAPDNDQDSNLNEKEENKNDQDNNEKKSNKRRAKKRKNIKKIKNKSINTDENSNDNDEDSNDNDNDAQTKQKSSKKKVKNRRALKPTKPKKEEKKNVEKVIDNYDDEEEEVLDNKSTPQAATPEKHNIPGTKVYWETDEQTGTLTFSGTGIIGFGEAPITAFNTSARPWKTGEGIKKIKILKGITGIADGLKGGGNSSGMFFGCYPELEEVEMADSVTSIGHGAFGKCPKLKVVNLGIGVKVIGEGAFNTCKCIKSIDIPPTVEKIGSGAFFGCKSLESINIPSSVKEIEQATFSDCTSLSYVTFSDDNPQLETISKNMFCQCSALSAIVLPSSVKKIESGAFKGCGNLVFVGYTGNTLPTLANDVPSVTKM